jgi:hypothetical protein
MGNEEEFLHFRLIHINVYGNQAWVVSGMSGKVSLRGQYRANFSDSDGL